jgi:nitrite reductase/ring-hydroxylating ferredoxin subunit
MENIFLSDTDYEELVGQTEALVKKVDELPYPKVKDDLHHLLQNFDLMHREALTRLFKEILINYPTLHSKMQADKSVHLLFGLYDLFLSEVQNDSRSFAANNHQNGNNQYPLWIPVGNIEALKENTTYKYCEDDENILLCKSGEKIYAVKNCCGNTALPLDGAAVDQGYIICPWHGCAYRLSDGVLESNPLVRLKKYPTEVNDKGDIKLGLNM